MNVSNLIVISIRHAVAEVFTTMLGVDIKPGEVTVEHAAPEASDGVVSFIGVAGNWTGTGSLSCSPALARRICSKMLQTESNAVGEEVLDAVAELTNMIIGNVKSDLEQHLGPLGLSIPTVIFGRDFKTKSGGNGDWITERFRWDGDELLVKLCLAPVEKFTSPARLGQTCPLEI